MGNLLGADLGRFGGRVWGSTAEIYAGSYGAR